MVPKWSQNCPARFSGTAEVLVDSIELLPGLVHEHGILCGRSSGQSTRFMARQRYMCMYVYLCIYIYIRIYEYTFVPTYTHTDVYRPILIAREYGTRMWEIQMLVWRLKCGYTARAARPSGIELMAAGLGVSRAWLLCVGQRASPPASCDRT